MLGSKKSVVSILSIGLLFACGSDDESPGNRGSLAGIMNAVESPTGTVDATTAPEVAVEFERAIRSDSAVPKQQQSGTQTMNCPGGGSTTINASGDQNNVQFDATYNDCCTEGCCLNGSATGFVAGADTESDYSICMSMSLSAMCEGLAAENVNYDMCLGSNGQIFVIEIEGQTFAVSGTYGDGNGTLEIKGDNGSFSCTFTGGSGSCTGDSGTFDF